MKKSLRVLIVEDSKDDTEVIRLEFKRRGYAIEWDRVENSEDMKKALKKQQWDLIVSDYSMPHFNGLEALELAREKCSDLPFILVSGAIGEETAVEVMKKGAHDYIMKDSLVRLVPAVERELKDAAIRREKRKADKALRESEKKFRVITENSADAIFITNQKGEYIYVNKAASDMLGYTQNELTKMSIPDISPRYTDDGPPKEFRQLLETGNLFSEIELQRKDGTIVSVEINAVILPNKMIFGSCRDIVERKKAEKALKESEERYQLAVDATQDGIWDWDITTGVDYFSPRWCEIIGYSYDDLELPHDYDSWASRIHPDDYERVQDALKAHIEEGKEYNVDYRHRHKSGKFRWQNSKGKVIFDDDGKPIRMVGCIRDITEKKKTDEKIKKDIKEKEIMLHEIHHRVKNNMQIITSLIRLQSQDLKNEEDKEKFMVTQNRIRAMALIHENLYESSNLSQINFSKYVKRMTTHLRAVHSTLSDRVKFNIDAEKIILDINQAIPCGLIINELVTNSLTHGFPKGKKGSISVNINADKKGNVTLIVADSGVGLPSKFNFQNPKALGMRLVSDLVKQLKGTIKLMREKGTIVTINF